jgi:hypothetical protein
MRRVFGWLVGGSQRLVVVMMMVMEEEPKNMEKNRKP